MLPIIDFKLFRDGDSASRREVADRIGAACESIGFMYVSNHGVQRDTIEAAERATRSFFAQPLERRRAVARKPGTYRGYIPMMPFSEDRSSGRAYLYEAFIVGPELEEHEACAEQLRWPNVWPSEPAELETALDTYYRAVTVLSDQLLEAFALALGQPENTLCRSFERPMTNISLLHYPASSPSVTADGANARPHYDTNALTILLPGEAGGLEVKHHELGWTEAPPRPGCFVVNIGNMMEFWSGGRFRSTMHRVHPPVGKERFSIAYFASPDYDTVVRPLGGTSSTRGAEHGSELHAGRAFASFVAGFDKRESTTDVASA